MQIGKQTIFVPFLNLLYICD